jgi:phosphoglucosamine mutase
MAIIALHMKKNNQLKDDTLVVTVMSNLGLDIFAAANGIKLAKTKVGDRYVIEEMVDKGYIIGGEQSGHIILLENSTTGDGLLSALKLLEVICTTKKSLDELSKVMHVLPQVLKGIKVKNEHKTAALEDIEVKATCNRIEKTLGDKGRILVRASGTEPLIRVMLEGEDIVQITCMCDEVIEIIRVKYAS